MAAPTILRDAAGGRHSAVVAEDGSVTVDGVRFAISTAADGSLSVTAPSRARVWVATTAETRWVFVDGHVHVFERERGRGRTRAAAHHASLTAPMPAAVRTIAVHVGDTVARGDLLIVLEAMKMELPVRATSDGRVTAIHCREGELVQPGVGLIEIDD